MPNPRSTDDILASLRGEFIEDAIERIAALQTAAVSFEKSGEDGGNALKLIRLEAHSLKGAAPTFGFHVLGLVAHHLEDYLADLPGLTADRLAGLIRYLDEMEVSIGLERDGQASDERIAAILRALPSRTMADGNGKPRRNALIVGPSRTAILAVETHLAEMGFRTTASANPLEALGVAVRMKPDLIATANLMELVSGVELACALGQMERTRRTPVIVYTSQSADSPGFRDLPSNVRVLTTGDAFRERLAEAVSAAL